MKLSAVHFKNFRCFRSESIEISDYVSFVGPNNCGKSTVLRALNIFFGGNAKKASISNEDFYIGAEKETSLSIKFEFDGITGPAAADLAHYVRSGRVAFEIVADRDASGQIASRCRGIRYGLPSLSAFFGETTAGGRKPIYEALVERFPEEIPRWSNMGQAEAVIRDFEARRSTEHVALPSEESAYGATGPLPKLKNYLDWIYVPAVKEVSTEATEQRDSAFSKLIMYAVRSRCDFSEQLEKIRNSAADALKGVLDGTSGLLAEISTDIDREFKNLTTTPIDVAIDWADIEDISIREPLIRSIFKDGRVRGAPEIFGHGLQRTYLMALLSLAARVQKESAEFRIILGIEEPELYQHPPQARYLANALSELSEGNAQILVTTHSPYFVTGKTFQSIRVLKKIENATKIYSWTVDEQRAYCAKRKAGKEIGADAALSGIDKTLRTTISEMFFASRIILVEGIEDAALIESYLRNIGRFNEFLKAGCHIVPVGGKAKMPMLVAMARGFNIEVYCVFDLDMSKKPNERGNDEMIRYAADVRDILSAEPETEFSGNFFFGWLDNIQGSLETECPLWRPTVEAVAKDWGWALSRMNKDPMLLSEAVSRIVNEGKNIPPLERLTEKLNAFWLRDVR